MIAADAVAGGPHTLSIKDGSRMLLPFLHAFVRRFANRPPVFRRAFVVGVVCLAVVLAATVAGSVPLVTTLNSGGDLTISCTGTSLTQTRLSATRRQLRCTGTTPTTPTTPAPPSGRPLRAAFYYGWYPSTWGSGSNFHPTAGQYSSTDASRRSSTRHRRPVRERRRVHRVMVGGRHTNRSCGPDRAARLGRNERQVGALLRGRGLHEPVVVVDRR